MIITLKIDDIRSRGDRPWVLEKIARFLDEQDPDARIDLKLQVIR